MQITASEEQIKKSLMDLNIPTLLMVMTQYSGDDRWLVDRYRPKPIYVPEGEIFPDDSGDYDQAIADEIRASALELILKIKDNELPLPTPPSAARMRKMMEFSVGEPLEQDFCEMLLEETNFIDRDLDWLDELVESSKKKFLDELHVVIVGAGMSGICTAAKLKRAGIRFTILEKNDAVGGTWYENTYPDCGVDTPNHFYSFSFMRNPNWSGYYSKRDELYEYFEKCTDQLDIRDNIKFRAEVTGMTFNVKRQSWTVDFSLEAGKKETIEANIVVSAVGQLNRPVVPKFDGQEIYNGESFHSARWRHDVDIKNKKVAVIGTGCSSVQLVPKTAEKAEHLAVFQRTPHWITPSRDYYRSVETGIKWALNYLPCYAEWHRARMIFGFMDRNWSAVVEDPNWQHKDRSMNEQNDMIRESFTSYISAQLGDRQDLLPKCVPDFPVYGKRPVIDNDWYKTLARDDVSLVDSPIKSFSEKGILTEDGIEHEFDVIIYATGFNTNRFLWPMDVKGIEGKNLEELWGETPEAYKGILVPGYPNLFCLYGPNTNIVHGGSIIYNTECQVHYMMQCIALMAEKEAREFEVSAEINDQYNKEVQELSQQLAWGHSGVQSWYKNSQGRVVNNSPFSNLEYWSKTHDIEPDVYDLS